MSRLKQSLVLPVILALSCCLVTQSGNAQRLYSQSRDEEAQEAKRRAEAVTSGGLFDTQLRNFEKLTKQDFATFFRVARTRMRADVGDFNTWARVKARVNARLTSVQSNDTEYNADTLEKARKDAQAKIDAARKALEELRAKIKAYKDPDTKPDPKQPKSPSTHLRRLRQAADALDDLQDFRNLTDRLANWIKIDPAPSGEDGMPTTDENGMPVKKMMDLSGFKAIENVAEEFLLVYRTYAQALVDVDKQTAELLELRVPLALIAVESAQLELDHLKTIGAIQTRRITEQAEFFELNRYFTGLYRFVEGYLTNLKVEGGAESGIEMLPAAIIASDKLTMKQKRDQLVNTMNTLHYAAAIVAHGGTPARLADLRLAHEEHLYSIRRSAVEARTYETTIRTGVQRLALYHKGGIKPEKVAEILHNLATIAIPPAIITK